MGVANLGFQEKQQWPMSTLLLRSMAVMVLQKSTAFDSRTFISASGLVGWDLRGNLMVLKTVIHRNVPSPFAAEGYACLE
ncbi:hypothetical protein Goarm_005098, partial [Gossypium armourianum]|nr:hypothetical protein [Gossypium armourianum]